MSIEQWSDLMFPATEGKDAHLWGSVKAVNSDGSYEVQLNTSSVTTRCSAGCTAGVGDRVLVCIMANGRCVAVARLEGTYAEFKKPIKASRISSDGNLTLIHGNTFRIIGADGHAYLEAPYGAGNYSTIGYGNYANGTNLKLFGKEVTVTSTVAGLSARAYGVNKVLWSGAYFMSANHIATLSEAVSAQPHGIVLIWSEYTNSAANDSGWSYYFVPKNHISAGVNGGVNCSTLHYGNSYIMSKYVYVRNTQVEGNALNADYADNERFVLRRIIGV